MSHHLYVTDGIVLKRMYTNGANASFSILTRDIGLVLATAKSVRRPQAKLKSALQDFSRSTLAFVRGKNGWLIVNAIPEENYYLASKDTPRKQRVFANVSALVSRLVIGEENDPKFIQILISGFNAVKESDISKIDFVECILVLRILETLGYVGKNEKLSPIFLDSSYSENILELVEKNFKEAVVIINKALNESQL